MLHAVIMAGGSGSRFWPKSIRAHPKQFLTLFGDRTMLQTTVERVEPLISAERIWVITNDRYVDLVAGQLPELPKENIIGEPVGKNTAPCVAAAAALINQKDEDATMAVLPADHLIQNTKAFLSVLEAGANKARKSDALLTIGIQPHRPETGYGYIEFEKDAEESSNGNEVYRVKQFREKPDETTAKKFIGAGNFLWNSGMFIWQTAVILREFEKHLPEINEQIKKLQAAMNDDKQSEGINAFYRASPSVSVDYGIMEKAENVFVIPGDFDWNDVGSWKALYELSEKDENGNAVKTDHAVSVDAQKNLVYLQSEKMIALVGMENTAVVETDDAILVCNLGEAQKVKQVVNQLRDKEEMKRFL